MDSVFFQLIENIYPDLHVVGAPLYGLLPCLLACVRYPACGGVVHFGPDDFECQFVVDSFEPDSQLKTVGSAYRLSSYGSKTFVNVPQNNGLVSWQYAYDRCSAINARLPEYPTTSRQRAILKIRTMELINIDLKLSSDGQFKNSDEEPTDTNIINWSNSNPNLASLACVAVGYDDVLQYCDIECYLNDGDDYEIACTY